MSNSNSTQTRGATWNAGNGANSRGRSPSRRNFNNENAQDSTIPSHIDERSSISRSHSLTRVDYPPQGSILPSGLYNGAPRSTSRPRNDFVNQNPQGSPLPPRVDQGNSSHYQTHQRSMLLPQFGNSSSSSSGHQWYHQSHQYPGRTRTLGVSFMNLRLDQQPPGPHNSYLQSNFDRQSQQYQYPRTGVSVMNPRLDQQSRGADNSFLPSNLDRIVAATQIRTNYLSPDEKKKQCEWDLQYLTMSGSCVDGFKWVRVDQPGATPGYRCIGTTHFVSDELIAEGKGGYYQFSKGSKHEAQEWKLKYPDPGKLERNAARWQKIGDMLGDLPSSRRW